MNDKRDKYNIDSGAELKTTTSNSEKEEKNNNINHFDEKLSPQKIIRKDSLIYFGGKLKSQFFKYQKCLYICLFVYILDYIVWFISRKHLKDLVNIFSLLISLILNLYSIYLFKDELNIISRSLYRLINKIIIFNIISLIIYYVNLFIIFSDKIVKTKFDGLLAKIFPNNKGLKMFYGVYLIVNFLFPALTLVYIIGVRKFVNILGIAKEERYKTPKTKRNVKEEKYNEPKTATKRLRNIKRQIVEIK